jgi:hypothetical protein
MTRPANAIDFWRGIALITIFVNHVPGIYYERFTHRNFSLSDSADLFVFLAGWAVSMVVNRPQSGPTIAQVFSRLWGRALTIYAAHIMIIMIGIAMLALAARWLDLPLLLSWHNAARVFYDPPDTHIGLVLLTHQLGYFDILPLYVVLMLMAPIMVLIGRLWPDGLLPISLVVYLLVLTFEINLPSWPNSGSWFFNPLAWQLLFVAGYVLGQDRGIGSVVRQHLYPIRIIALPIVLAGAVMVSYSMWPDPTRMPDPKLLFVANKTFVTPIRVIQFLALVAVMSIAFPYIMRMLPRMTNFFSMLGRNSLNVFCVGSLLSLAAQILRFAYKGYAGIDTIILIVGIVCLGFTAWISEWNEKTKKAA